MNRGYQLLTLLRRHLECMYKLHVLMSVLVYSPLMESQFTKLQAMFLYLLPWESLRDLNYWGSTSKHLQGICPVVYVIVNLPLSKLSSLVLQRQPIVLCICFSSRDVPTRFFPIEDIVQAEPILPREGKWGWAARKTSKNTIHLHTVSTHTHTPVCGTGCWQQLKQLATWTRGKKE